MFSFKKFWYLITEPKVMSAENTSGSKEGKDNINNKSLMTKDKQAWSVARCHDNKLVCPLPNLCADQ